MFDPLVLRKYAQNSDPSQLPVSKVLTHSDKTITIFDAYPKATFHFLVLPRIFGSEPWTASRLSSLTTLLKVKASQGSRKPNVLNAWVKKGAKSDVNVQTGGARKVMEEAKEVLECIKRDAEVVKGMVEQEMQSRFGAKWKIWMGFHSVPSMEHMHLHVISEDLCSSALKTKRHYNSFHPKLGFFLHLHEVMEWSDAESDVFNMLSTINVSESEAKLKEPLVCFRCGRSQKNIPALKEHLQTEFDRLLDTERRKNGAESDASRSNSKKRKHEPEDESSGVAEELLRGANETMESDREYRYGNSNKVDESTSAPKRPHVNEDTEA